MKSLKAYANIGLIRLGRALGWTRIPTYPFVAYIEPTMFCNLRCPACPTGQKLGLRPAVAISFDRFKQLIDELGQYLFAIDMYNSGEPLLHKELTEMIAYAKTKQIRVRLCSNLSLRLAPDFSRRLVESGLDELMVALDGCTAETYGQYRLGGDFDRVRGNLRAIRDARDRLGRRAPEIVWQFVVFRHNEHEIPVARRVYRDWGADRILFQGAWLPHNAESLGLQASTREVYDLYGEGRVGRRWEAWRRAQRGNLYVPGRRKSPCSWLWYTVVIYPNGSIPPCCAVVDERHDFGSVGSGRPFRTVWNGPLYRKARAFVLGSSAASRPGHELVRIEKTGCGIGIGLHLERGQTICEKCPIPGFQDRWDALPYVGRGLMAAFRNGGLWTRLKCVLAYALMGFPQVQRVFRPETWNRAVP